MLSVLVLLRMLSVLVLLRMLSVLVLLRMLTTPVLWIVSVMCGWRVVSTTVVMVVSSWLRMAIVVIRQQIFARFNRSSSSCFKGFYNRCFRFLKCQFSQILGYNTLKSLCTRTMSECLFCTACENGT